MKSKSKVVDLSCMKSLNGRLRALFCALGIVPTDLLDYSVAYLKLWNGFVVTKQRMELVLSSIPEGHGDEFKEAYASLSGIMAMSRRGFEAVMRERVSDMSEDDFVEAMEGFHGVEDT